MNPVEQQIIQKLQAALTPTLLEIENESHKHSVPPDSETHFKAVIVSDAFDHRRLVARHQKVYAILAEELAGPVHALALHTYTESEWQKREGAAPLSPECRGGSKHDAQQR